VDDQVSVHVDGVFVGGELDVVGEVEVVLVHEGRIVARRKLADGDFRTGQRRT
jgi:hypothetical protein